MSVSGIGQSTNTYGTSPTGGGSSLGAAALPQSDAKAEFLKWAHMTPAEKMRASLLSSMGLTEEQVQAMSPDDRTRLLEELPAEATRRLLETLSPDELKVARTLLGYPEGTAGRYMTPQYVALPPDITARAALDMAEVDREGLDKQDRRYLETLVRVFDGGPTGVEAIAATMNIPADTLSDEIEPFLLREQFVIRSPRGRLATPKTFTLLGLPIDPKNPPPPGLFD